GKFKNCELIQGNIKGYDADKKELTFTNLSKESRAYSLGTAPVRVNLGDSKIEDVKIGDTALIIVDKADGKETLRCVMVQRAKYLTDNNSGGDHARAPPWRFSPDVRGQAERRQ